MKWWLLDKNLKKLMMYKLKFTENLKIKHLKTILTLKYQKTVLKKFLKKLFFGFFGEKISFMN